MGAISSRPRSPSARSRSPSAQPVDSFGTTVVQGSGTKAKRRGLSGWFAKRKKRSGTKEVSVKSVDVDVVAPEQIFTLPKKLTRWTRATVLIGGGGKSASVTTLSPWAD